MPSWKTQNHRVTTSGFIIKFLSDPEVVTRWFFRHPFRHQYLCVVCFPQIYRKAVSRCRKGIYCCLPLPSMLHCCPRGRKYRKNAFPKSVTMLYYTNTGIAKGDIIMRRIKTLATRDLKESMKKGGCGECQTSCQSACKTSCTVGNQSCEKVK